MTSVHQIRVKSDLFSIFLPRWNYGFFFFPSQKSKDDQRSDQLRTDSNQAIGPLVSCWFVPDIARGV
nr:hypothetical protein BgiMline_006877 [Biomphalaria glabrata]